MSKFSLTNILIIVAPLVLIGSIGYTLTTLSSQQSQLSVQLAADRKTIASYQTKLHEHRQTIDTLTNERNEALLTIELLQNELADEKEAFDRVESQVRKIAGTVQDIEKLAELDSELLQKYSKVSFLNEHYRPPELVAIDEDWSANTSKEYTIRAEVWPFLEKLLESAEDDDVDLRVVSAYRSFYDQAILKGQYLVSYGSGANRFSADQGYSEHQLGTAVDLSTPALGGGLSGFGDSAAYQWLLDEAWRYGFVLSYPEGNQYYVFEPWHWRFVGEDLARYLHRKELQFYDMDQREIDEYLLEIFED